MRSGLLELSLKVLKDSHFSLSHPLFSRIEFEDEATETQRGS